MQKTLMKLTPCDDEEVKKEQHLSLDCISENDREQTELFRHGSNNKSNHVKNF